MPVSREEHTFKRFDQDLDELRDLIMEMGGLVENQIELAMNALREEDINLAHETVARDHKVNSMEIRADDKIANMIALRQPMGSDLRMIMTFAKSVTDLERIGDEAEKIARMVVHIYDNNSVPNTRLFRNVSAMAQQASAMLRDSLDALTRQDADKAFAITRRDEELDDNFRDALRQLITYMMEDPRTIGKAIDVLFVIKALERIGDHSKNIAEYVIYLVKGKDVRHLSAEATQDIVEDIP